MWIWLYVVRLSAMRKVRLDMDRVAVEGIGPHDLPKTATGVANNYNHLHEQPTIFYALCLAMHLMQGYSETDIYLARGYVLFRAIHSLVQSLVHNVMLRFPVFVWAHYLFSRFSSKPFGLWAAQEAPNSGNYRERILFPSKNAAGDQIRLDNDHLF